MIRCRICFQQVMSSFQHWTEIDDPPFKGFCCSSEYKEYLNMGKTSVNVRFSGHSDDIICYSIDRQVQFCDARGDDLQEVADEITANISEITKIKVTSIGGAMGCLVRAVYDDGTWSFSAGLLADGHKIPVDWNIKILNHHEYSTELIIDTNGEDVIVEKIEEQ